MDKLIMKYILLILIVIVKRTKADIYRAKV